MMWDLNKRIHEKHLEHSLAHRKYVKDINTTFKKVTEKFNDF